MHVGLNVFGVIVLVEVDSQVSNEVETVANDDEWQLLWEFGLLEEVAGANWVVVV